MSHVEQLVSIHDGDHATSAGNLQSYSDSPPLNDYKDLLLPCAHLPPPRNMPAPEPKQLVADKTVSIHLISTQQQLSDILTKPLAAPAHEHITDQLVGYSKLAQTSAPAAPFALHAARMTPHQAVLPKTMRAVRD